MERPESLPVVIGDADRIAQVLMNLLSNAIKYTNEGGKVGLHASFDDRFVAITVSDTGIGIPLKDQAKLFEKFYRVDNSLTREVGGTGLGLSIVKTLVKMHGGDIWVESKVGRGSKFTFTLPVVGGAIKPAKKKDRPEQEELHGAGRTVLVVDDEEDIVQLMKIQLEKEGYTIITALSGEEAIEIAKQEKPDIITLDILMEGINGFEVIRRLDEDPATASIPVIVISVICDEQQCYTFGGASYLTKPIERRRLSETVRNLIDSRDKERQAFILVIDDGSSIARMIREAFQSKEYAVQTVANVDEAVALSSTVKPDVIVLDSKMAAGDSHRTIERLRKCGDMAETEVILFTDFDAEKVMQRMLGSESDGKCSVVTVDSIARRIEQILEGSEAHGE